MGQNRARSRPIAKFWWFDSVLAERCLRCISAKNESIIWKNFLLGSCRYLKYLSVHIKITSIGVPNEKLWPKYEQCSRSLRHMSAEDSMIDHGKTMIDHGPTITSIGVPNEKLWPKYEQCSRSLRHMSAEDSMIDHGKTMIDHGPTITSIGVPSEKLWSKYEQCSRSLRHMSAEDSMIDHGKTMIDHGPTFYIPVFSVEIFEDSVILVGSLASFAYVLFEDFEGKSAIFSQSTIAKTRIAPAPALIGFGVDPIMNASQFQAPTGYVLSPWDLGTKQLRWW
ncbi:hypothetical protein LguiA_029999 [Lonicera macranthoides]